MRISFSRWSRVALATVGLVSFTLTGCKSGMSWPTASWPSWGKTPSTSALASSKPSNLPPPPSTSFTPSPSPTAAAGTGVANAGGYGQAYPSTASASPAYGSTGYGAQQAAALQAGGYQNSPYGASPASASPGGSAYANQMPAAGSSTGAAGGYPQYSSTSPASTTWQQGSQYSSPTSAPPAATGYGADSYRTADQRSAYGTPSPATSSSGSWNTTVTPSSGGYGSPTSGYNSGASTGYGSPAASGYSSNSNNAAAATNSPVGFAQAPAAKPATGATTSGGYGQDTGYSAPRSLEPASGSFSSVPTSSPGSNMIRGEGGYRPGSTSRAQPIESAQRPDSGVGVQPAGFQSNGGFTATPQPYDNTGFQPNRDSGYVPPSDNNYQP